MTLRADSALFDIEMHVTNLAGKPMDLMYMAHMNYAYVDGARFVEPLGMQRLRLRTSVPDHVKPTPAWSAYMAQLAEHPGQLACLETPALYDPEIVFFSMVSAPTPPATRTFCLSIPTALRSTPVIAPSNSNTLHAGSCTHRISKWLRSCCRRPASRRATPQRKPKVTCGSWRPGRALHSA